MDSAELNERARALYVSRRLYHAPAWELLGSITQGVWHGYVLDGQCADEPQETGANPGASSNNERNQ